MQDQLVKRVFQAWQLADSIDGGEVDVRNAKALRQQFDEIEAAFSDETARKKGTNSLVYLGEYNKQALRHEIQQTLFHDDQPIENEDPAVGYSVGLIMGADWQLQSIFIPKVAYFYLQLRGTTFNGRRMISSTAIIVIILRNTCVVKWKINQSTLRCRRLVG